MDTDRDWDGPPGPASEGDGGPVTNGRHREANGRFGPKNTFSKGCPNLRKIQSLRHRLLSAVSDETIDAIGGKLCSLAADGDLEAIKVLFTYTIGRPPASLALTDPEGGALGSDMPALLGAIRAALADYPEAQLVLAARLKRLADDARDDA